MFVVLILCLLSVGFSAPGNNFIFRRVRVPSQDIRVRTITKTSFSYQIDAAITCVEQTALCYGYKFSFLAGRWKLLFRDIRHQYNETKHNGKFVIAYLLRNVPPLCSEDFNKTYIDLTSSWYALTAPASWLDAWESCKVMGSRLAWLTSPQELSFAANLSSEVGSDLWVAARGNSGVWVWSHTENEAAQLWLWGGSSPPPAKHDHAGTVVSSGSLRSAAVSELKSGLCECYGVREA